MKREYEKDGYFWKEIVCSTRRHKVFYTKQENNRKTEKHAFLYKAGKQ